MQTSKRKPEELADIARQRAGIYGFLSFFFLKEPTSELLEKFRPPEFVEAFKELGININEGLSKEPEEELIEELAIEYTQLFIGPGGHIYPYESARLEGKYWGDTTVEVLKFYEHRCDYRMSKDWTMPPDHISLEFEMIQSLAEKEAVAWEEGDDAKAIELLKMQKEFLEEHVMKWVPSFCEDVEEGSDHPLFRNMAKLTREFVNTEHLEL